MDILLTHGYFLNQDPAELALMRPYPPLGLLYISAHLKARGFAVEVEDTTFSGPAAFRARVLAARPPVVGIYANLMTRANVLEAMSAAREAGSRVVLGGPEPVNYASEYLDRGADVIVAGEGELTLEALLPHLARHGLDGLEAIDGIVFRGPGGGPVTTRPRAKIQDLDAQPFPDRAAIDLSAYMAAWRSHHGASSVSLITARGCPFTCDWCSHSVFGFSYRQRSPENVADELEAIRESYAPDGVWYADDVFTLNKKWIFAFRDELARRRLKLPFETISREDRLDDAVIGALAEMGCRRLWIGAESGSQRILDAMDRRTDAARTREMIALLKRHGIETGTFIMLGYDGEEWDDITATAEHLKASLPETVLTTIAYPIKGTPYYEKLAGRRTGPDDWAAGSDREIAVSGRHSRRFYGHAARWIQGEVALARERRGAARISRMARAWVRARLGRFGMHATRRQVERP